MSRHALSTSGSPLNAPRSVCFPFVGDSVGGAQLSTLLLAENLDRQRYWPVVVVHEGGSLLSHLAHRDVDVELLPVPRHVGRAARPTGHLRDLATSSPPLVRFLRRRRLDLVHTNDGRMNMTWVGPTRLSGAAHVWHQRSWFPRSRLAQVLVRASSKVLCISEYTRQTLPRGVDSLVIDNPFSLDEPTVASRAALRDELGLPKASTVVGWAGRLTPQKRPIVFVEVAERIAASVDHRIAFAMFGRGTCEETAALKRKIDSTAHPESFHLMGFRHPLEPLLAACDLLVVPAVGDAFGRTLVEAAIAGTPVVAARSGGHPEIIDDGETGVLVEPDNAAAFAEAVLDLLADPGRTVRFVEAARRRARERYSVDAHVGAVTKVYDELLA